MSIPRTTDFTENQRLAWSVFYTASVTFPFVVTFLYWSVLESSEIHASKSLNGDPLHDWLVYSIYAVNCESLFGKGAAN